MLLRCIDARKVLKYFEILPIGESPYRILIVQPREDRMMKRKEPALWRALLNNGRPMLLEYLPHYVDHKQQAANQRNTQRNQYSFNHPSVLRSQLLQEPGTYHRYAWNRMRDRGLYRNRIGQDRRRLSRYRYASQHPSLIGDNLHRQT